MYFLSVVVGFMAVIQCQIVQILWIKKDMWKNVFLSDLNLKRLKRGLVKLMWRFYCDNKVIDCKNSTVTG